jgi:hypothetical protein
MGPGKGHSRKLHVPYQPQAAGMTGQYNGMLKCHLCIRAPNPPSWNRWAEWLPNVVCLLNDYPRRDGHSLLNRLLASGQMHLTSSTVNAACSNYNFKRANTKVVLAMGNTW